MHRFRRPWSRVSSVLIGSLAIALGLGLAARAQTRPAAGRMSQNDMKQRFAAAIEKSSAPTEAHQALAPLVGEFDETVDVHLGPGEPMRVRGVSSGKWIMGGRFV